MTRRQFLAAGTTAAAAGTIFETACSSPKNRQGSAPVNGWQYATPIFVAQALEEEFGFRVPKGFE